MTNDTMATVHVTDPYSSKGLMKLRIQGSVVDSEDYTMTIYAHVRRLVRMLDKAGVHIWEFNVDKLIPRPEMCECCGLKKRDVKDLTVSFRVEHGISGIGAWEIIIEELGWMPIAVWLAKPPKGLTTTMDVWIYLKKVV